MQKPVTWILVLSIVASPAFAQLGTSAPAMNIAAEKTELRNVELDKDGCLRGQIVTNEGGAISNVKIQVHSQADMNQVAQVVTTGERGNFLVQGVQTGTCVVSVGEDSYACRVWQNGTAPPKSLNSIALVASSSLVRGNACGDCGHCAECTGRGGFIMNKLRCMTPGQKVGLGLIVAAAIALPIALSNDKDNAS